tara:strand:+ start:379 stop:546 length:168 start_codon:yes stop_codon:yes gene_type:complete
MITKIITLSLIIILVLFVFRLFNKKSSLHDNKNEIKEKIVDLEKDPKTDEYKPKE